MMLTQKGREPFIRMQMFIDDPDAIKKLINVYKCSPDDVKLIEKEFNDKEEARGKRRDIEKERQELAEIN